MNSLNAFTPFYNCDYTVALIDSDEALNNNIANKLRAVGCTVVQAFSSDEIADVIAQRLDYILIDPVYELCNEFQLREYLQRPDAAGVIINTSDDSPQRREYLF
ncbi:MAG: hypothetical protein Q8J85_08870, partial [Sulfuricurvum sp.]|nr:hypothetical protein [Sulfuricurvum sp.]